MGLEEKVEEDNFISRIKDGLKDAAPWIGAMAVGGIVYYTINNIEMLGINQPFLNDAPEHQKLIFSACLAWPFKNVFSYIQYSHLFRNRSKSNEERSLEEKCEEKQDINKDNLSKTKIWNTFKFALRHPKTTASLITSYLFYDTISTFIAHYKNNIDSGEHIMKIIANPNPLWKKVGETELSKLNESYSGLIQLLAMGLLFDALALLSASLAIKSIDSLTHSKDYTKTIIKQVYCYISGDKEGLIKCNEKLADILPSRESYLNIAFEHITMGHMDEALEAWSSGFKLPPTLTKVEEMMRDLGLFMQNQYITQYKKYSRGIRRNPADIKNYVNLSVTYLRLNKISESMLVQEQIKEAFPDNAEARALYALILEGIGRKEEARQKWGETIGILLQGSDLSSKFHKIGESVNDVLEYSPSKFFKKSLVFKKGNLQSLEDEVMLTKEDTRIVKETGKSDIYLTTEPVNIFDYDNSNAYVMKRDPGRLLYNIQERKEIVYDVADYLALIHARMSTELTRKGRVNIPKTLEDKLRSRDLNLPKHLIDKIKSNYAPVLDSLKDAVYVFNKDAHPEQWLVREDGAIVALDWEDKGLVPMQFDLANLMEYDDTLNDEDKNRIIEQYIQSYNDYKGEEVITDIRKFKLVYLNSVIQRALSLCSSWSSPGREDMAAKRGLLVRNALNSIDIIRREHAEYYAAYQENYQNLINAFIEFNSLVVEHEHGS